MLIVTFYAAIVTLLLLLFIIIIHNKSYEVLRFELILLLSVKNQTWCYVSNVRSESP